VSKTTATRKTASLAALLYDARLTETARIIGIHIAIVASGDEPVEIPYDDFARILESAPSVDTIARHIRQLIIHGYVDRKSGGRGSPRFMWTRCSGPHFCGLKEKSQDSTPQICGPECPLYSAHMRTIRLLRKFADHTESLVRTHADQKSDPIHINARAPARASSTSKEPPPLPLDARAREFISESESLVGTRDSLMDYLKERVEVSRQLAYAQTVAGMVEGTDERVWMARDGTRFTERRVKIISGCLNEMRQADEVGRYFPGSPGDVRNLQSKIRYKVKAETDAKRDAERRTDNGATSRESRSGKTPIPGGSADASGSYL
jgi:hypothetical protein